MTVLNNILYDAETMASLENAQVVVLAETAKATLYKEVEEEYDYKV